MESVRTYDDYKKLINSREKIIVKFYADWCPDCGLLNEFIQPVMREYNYLGWYELNSDEVPSAAEENDIEGIPSLLIFQHGRKVAHLHSSNAKSARDVKRFLRASL